MSSERMPRLPPSLSPPSSLAPVAAAAAACRRATGPMRVVAITYNDFQERKSSTALEKFLSLQKFKSCRLADRAAASRTSGPTEKGSDREPIDDRNEAWDLLQHIMGWVRSGG